MSIKIKDTLVPKYNWRGKFKQFQVWLFSDYLITSRIVVYAKLRCTWEIIIVWLMKILENQIITSLLVVCEFPSIPFYREIDINSCPLKNMVKGQIYPNYDKWYVYSICRTLGTHIFLPFWNGTYMSLTHGRGIYMFTQSMTEPFIIVRVYICSFSVLIF